MNNEDITAPVIAVVCFLTFIMVWPTAWLIGQAMEYSKVKYLIKHHWECQYTYAWTQVVFYHTYKLVLVLKAEDEENSRSINEAYKRQKLLEKHEFYNIPLPDTPKPVAAGSWMEV